jgi:hypothetical protein
MIAWTAVDSSWVVAEAYSEEEETIYVKFKDGTAWAYTACPPQVWLEFTAFGQSRGQYINRVLKFKPGRKFVE